MIHRIALPRFAAACLVLAGSVAPAQAAQSTYSATYSPTVAYNTVITNGQNYNSFIDLSGYLPSGTGVSNVIDSISVKVNFADDTSDTYNSSTVETTVGGITIPWVLANSRFVGEYYGGYSGGQQMFVDVFAKDYLTTMTYEGESALVKLLLPNGDEQAQNWSAGVADSGISKTGETQLTSWNTNAAQHYSCAIGAHYCHDSIHDYWSVTQQWDYARTLNPHLGGTNTFGLDANAFNGNQGFWLAVSGTGGDLVLSSVSVDFTATTTVVPEPETYAMMLAGLGLVGFMGRRRKQAEA